MKLKNTLIAVKDIEKSKKFYNDLFGIYTLKENKYLVSKYSLIKFLACR